jgi:lactoylglutathione lyase
MNERTKAGRVLQMRLVVEAPEYEQAVVFYRDVLGAPEELVVEGDQGERVTILDMGRATLEIADPAQVAMIDDVEVGRRVSPRLRVAFEVSDANGVTGDLAGGRCRVACRTDRDSVAVAQFAVFGAGGSADHGLRGAGQQG